MLNPEQIERLQHTIQEGAIIRDWCQQQGFKLFKSWIESKIEDKKKDWLTANDKEEAEKIRVQTQVWLDVMNEFKIWMLKGDNASHLLKEDAKEREAEANFNSPSTQVE